MQGLLGLEQSPFFFLMPFLLLHLQINLLAEKKMELERRIDSLVNEREGLSSTLDESSDRIIMLEKQSREQEALVGHIPYNDPFTFIYSTLGFINWLKMKGIYWDSTSLLCIPLCYLPSNNITSSITIINAKILLPLVLSYSSTTTITKL